MVFSEAADKVTVRFVGPAASLLVELSAIETVGASSSSVMVIVAEPSVVLIFALTGVDKLISKVSSISSTVSCKIGIRIVFVKSPGAKVSVSLTAV